MLATQILHATLVENVVHEHDTAISGPNGAVAKATYGDQQTMTHDLTQTLQTVTKELVFWHTIPSFP